MNSKDSLEGMILRNFARRKGIDESSARRILTNDEREVEQGEFVMEGDYTALDVIAKFDQKHVSKIRVESFEYAAKIANRIGTPLGEYDYLSEVIEAFDNSHPNYRIDDITTYTTGGAIFRFSKATSNKS